MAWGPRERGGWVRRGFMRMVPSRYVFFLLTFVTVGMAVGALLQLAFLKRLEESSGSGFQNFRRISSGDFGNQTLGLASGLSLWHNDEEARILRIGLLKQEVISWNPRIILFHSFLSADECDHLINVARARLVKSTVVDANTGKARIPTVVPVHLKSVYNLIYSLPVRFQHLYRPNRYMLVKGPKYEQKLFKYPLFARGIESKVRTSTGMFLNANDRRHHVIEAIEKRISTYSMIPVENGELLQVLRYEADQYYKAHHDYFADEFNLKRGGQRVATMLMYLTDGVEGGETLFPGVGDKDCSCGGEMKRGICVKPKRGDAVLFWSMKLDGQVDPTSLHGGCKVLAGEKWSSTKWMRQHAFD